MPIVCDASRVEYHIPVWINGATNILGIHVLNFLPIVVYLNNHANKLVRTTPTKGVTLDDLQPWGVKPSVQTKYTLKS